MDKTLYYMQKAIEQAEIAAAENEVPVGAVIVRNDEIVATGRNRREQGKNALLHAETDAIYKACKKLGGWRLWNCEIYVTLEPCPMCAGAIINAHIPNLAGRTARFEAIGLEDTNRLLATLFGDEPRTYMMTPADRRSAATAGDK